MALRSMPPSFISYHIFCRRLLVQTVSCVALFVVHYNCVAGRLGLVPSLLLLYLPATTDEISKSVPCLTKHLI